MTSTASIIPSQPQQRFTTSRATLLVDWFMTRVITIGGIAVIAAVMLICVFILAQVLPLFQSASVKAAGSRDVSAVLVGKPLALGLDEWGEMPFIMMSDGKLAFIPKIGEVRVHNLSDKSPTVAAWDEKHHRLVVGTEQGTVFANKLEFKSKQVDGRRETSETIESLGDVNFGEGRIATVAWQGPANDPRVVAIVQRKEKYETLVGSPKGGLVDLTSQMKGTPQHLLLDETAQHLLVADKDGLVTYFFRQDQDFTNLQTFAPFADLPEKGIQQSFFLFGDQTAIFISKSGVCRGYGLFRREGEGVRSWNLTKNFDDLPASKFVSNAPSVRNKAFLVTADRTVSLRYGTSEAIRWEEVQDRQITHSALSAKYEQMAFLTEDRQLRFMELHDPHPEASFAAFFMPVWYEGFAEPKYEWQSTSGTDDFEPKLSMIPLIWGTFKATFYTLMFAIPVALLAAIYTAEFMHPRFKSIVKPSVEVMASLPSVVLGFLAALWLAPLIEFRVPSVISLALVLPTTAMLIGYAWSFLRPSVRSKLPAGFEFLVAVPVMILAGIIAWQIGLIMDPILFKVTVTPLGGGDPTVLVGFNEWWRNTTGLSYEQRNSMVVGIMMGFAVIPIIFTIAEDSLSNVPVNLRSGSLALGASRWQTALRVVVPTASAGIFSAVMIGIGRAIGETMIVVMATGNTGIIDPNIFNGMRTLSANIAVELPEAPHGSTLYRSLFLGAFLLFAFTFVINTIAELMRQRLRERYKTV